MGTLIISLPHDYFTLFLVFRSFIFDSKEEDFSRKEILLLFLLLLFFLRKGFVV